jgi:hypothetical protein
MRQEFPRQRARTDLHAEAKISHIYVATKGMLATARCADHKFDQFAVVIRFSLEKNQISGILCRFSAPTDRWGYRTEYQP